MRTVFKQKDLSDIQLCIDNDQSDFLEISSKRNDILRSNVFRHLIFSSIYQACIRKRRKVGKILIIADYRQKYLQAGYLTKLDETWMTEN